MADFRLLGDIEVVVDGQLVDIGHARQRCVAAVLLVEANRAVSVDQLAERVWSGRPPKRHREVLYSYVSRLRRSLTVAPDVAIRRNRDGYVLEVDPAAVDLHRFVDLAARARAADDDARALALFDQALALWRGEAFSPLDSMWLATVRVGLERQRLAAELDRNEIMVRRGLHHRLAADLPPMLARNPLHERLTGQLVRALYFDGQIAEALDACRVFRRRLADELGVDPGPELRKLELAVLRHELEPPSRPAASPAENAVDTDETLSESPARPTLIDHRAALLTVLLLLSVLAASAVIGYWTERDQQARRVQVGNVGTTPVYLQAEPLASCAQHHCELVNHPLRPNDFLVVQCYTNGDTMTEPVTGHPGPTTVRSAGWYGMPTAGGALAYVAEVWLQSQYHGGLGLPLCPTPSPLKAR